MAGDCQIAPRKRARRRWVAQVSNLLSASNYRRQAGLENRDTADLEGLRYAALVPILIPPALDPA